MESDDLGSVSEFPKPTLPYRNLPDGQTLYGPIEQVEDLDFIPLLSCLSKKKKRELSEHDPNYDLFFLIGKEQVNKFLSSRVNEKNSVLFGNLLPTFKTTNPDNQATLGDVYARYARRPYEEVRIGDTNSVAD